ncbi:MAG: YmdB family metallophosphoesterase [Cyanophyceae cyanobacterium]
MRVLFFGDVVGEVAVQALANHLPQWREDYSVDLVIANAENSVLSNPDNPTCGFGITPTTVSMLLSGGVDIITGGNHSWDAPEATEAHSHPSVIRPLNIIESMPGQGIISLDIQGETVVVINLMGSSAATSRYTCTNLLEAVESQQFPEKCKIIIDIHTESVFEKIQFANALDGKVAAILGTHTHEPSLLMHHLPKGTCFVTDVGMNGPSGGMLGMLPDFFVHRIRQKENSIPLQLASGPIQLGAVLLDLNPNASSIVKRFKPMDWSGVHPE